MEYVKVPNVQESLNLKSVQLVDNDKQEDRNKPGTAQVGFISKAQKYSRTNHWKNLEIFFSKKLFGKKKSHMAEKPKKIPFRLIKRFLQIENFKKFKGVPFDRIEKFSEKKCRIVPKKSAKRGPFGLPSTFGSIKNLWFSARLEPTLSCFSDPRKSGLTSKKLNK